MASNATGGWLAKLRGDNLPLAVAVQGLALVLLAFLPDAPPQPVAEENASGNGWLTDHSPTQSISGLRIPTDMHPEQIRLPRFPDSKQQVQQRQPAPSEDRDQARVLGALRIDSISIQAPTTIQAALGLPEAPDHLSPGSISLGRFGDGSGPSGFDHGRGRGGMGGVGVGGEGDGPRCHPERPGSLRNPRNPISGPPPVIEPALGYPY